MSPKHTPGTPTPKLVPATGASTSPVSHAGRPPEASSADTAIRRWQGRRPWMAAAHAAWILVACAALVLFLAGVRERQSGLRWSYWGWVPMDVREETDGKVRVSPWWDGEAARAGILEGDELIAVNDRPVTTVQQAQAWLTRDLHGPVALSVRTGSFPIRRYVILPIGPAGGALAALGLSSRFVGAFLLVIDLLFALTCLAVALVIFWKRVGDWRGLLISATLLVGVLGTSVPVMHLGGARPEARGLFDLWYVLAVVFMMLFFFLFPDGRFWPRWTRSATLLIAISLVILLLNRGWYFWTQKPLLYIVWLGVLLAAGMLAQALRYRHIASAEQRRQTGWVVLGAGAAATGILLQTVPVTISLPLPQLVSDLVLYPVGQALRVLFPLSVAIAIFRYHLWDVDVVINRTLVYGTLTLAILTLYVAIVGGLGALLRSTDNIAVSLVATGIIAVIFQPLRGRLQKAANRLMYGERDEPYRVMARLGRQLEDAVAPDALLSALVETVGQALRLPYVAIETPYDQSLGAATAVSSVRTAVEYGQPAGEALRLPLLYQSEPVGYLLAAPRRAGEPLSAADRTLLATIASQAGAAVHVARLTVDLQRSRERLVHAREEERRRIRRDLHDGLGPELAALAMEADAAAESLQGDPALAVELLRGITAKAQAALSDIRRLVYGLRPPALDELGLANALAQQATAFARNLETTVIAPNPLPALPAAVEVAAYRIASEALNNVARHARARRCTITIEVGGELRLEIVDDGIGLPANHTAGIGSISMRERAVELSGSCTVESTAGTGTRVLASIPLPPDAQEALPRA